MKEAHAVQSRSRAQVAIVFRSSFPGGDRHAHHRVVPGCRGHAERSGRSGGTGPGHLRQIDAHGQLALLCPQAQDREHPPGHRPVRPQRYPGAGAGLFRGGREPPGRRGHRSQPVLAPGPGLCHLRPIAGCAPGARTQRRIVPGRLAAGHRYLGHRESDTRLLRRTAPFPHRPRADRDRGTGAVGLRPRRGGGLAAAELESAGRPGGGGGAQPPW